MSKVVCKHGAKRWLLALLWLSMAALSLSAWADDDDDDIEKTGVESSLFESDEIDENDDSDDNLERGKLRSGGDLEDQHGMFDVADFDIDLNHDEALDEQGLLIRSGEIIAIDVDAAVIELAQSIGFAVTERHRLDALALSMVVLSLPEGWREEEAITRLRAEVPNGVFDYNHLYRLSRQVTTSAPHSPQSLPESFRFGVAGSVGLIDTLVDTSHPMFASTQIEQRSFVSGPVTAGGHGTAIASLLVGSSGQLQGKLLGSQLYSAAVFHDNHQGEPLATAKSLSLALDWMAQKQVPVINLSLAGPPNHLLAYATKRIADKGHLLIAAVGNDGPAAAPRYPAAYPEVVAVSAFDQYQRIYRQAGRGPHLDFSAPGVNLSAASSDHGYALFSGTSFAVPHVAAYFARRLATPDRQLREQLLDNARQRAIDLGASGHDPLYGYGWLTEGAR